MSSKIEMTPERAAEMLRNRIGIQLEIEGEYRGGHRGIFVGRVSRVVGVVDPQNPLEGCCGAACSPCYGYAKCQGWVHNGLDGQMYKVPGWRHPLGHMCLRMIRRIVGGDPA